MSVKVKQSRYRPGVAQRVPVFVSLYLIIYECKGKAVPLQAWSGPGGSSICQFIFNNI